MPRRLIYYILKNFIILRNFHFILIFNLIISEKHLPNLKKQPNNVPIEISAITNNTINIDGSILSACASTPTSSNSASNLNIQSEDDIFNKESPVKEESYLQNRPKSINKYINNKANKRRTKKESNNYNEIPNENDYSQLNSNSNNQFQAQLVPIQTFSFFKWKINVDTLVRLFIIA